MCSIQLRTLGGALRTARRRIRLHHLGMKRLQLSILPRQDVLYVTPKHLAQGGLWDACSLSNALLSPAVLNQCANEVSCFHLNSRTRLFCHAEANMQLRFNARQ